MLSALVSVAILLRLMDRHLPAMVSPELAVVTAPHCSFRVTVPLVVGSHCSVVADPTLKS